MSGANLQSVLEREHAHAAAIFRLDDELGTRHGLSWADFVLMDHLCDEDAGVQEARLAEAVGVLRSKLLMRTRPLEKLGLVSRSAADAGRRIALSPAGRRLLAEARETAEVVCSQIRAS